MASISGLGSGLDTNAIIAQLVGIERRTQDVVRSRGNRIDVALSSFAAIRTQLTALRSAASAAARTPDWQALRATSSNPDAVAVSAGAGSLAGSLSFTVDALATAGSFRSQHVLAGLDTVVAADDAILVASGAARLGFATLASDDALATGEHDIEVTQGSGAAAKQGSVAIAASTVVNAGNNTLNVTVNGVAKVLTIANGTYSRSQLAAAVQAAADSASAAITVDLDEVTNKLVLATTREGSAATIQVTGGNAVNDLGLTVDGSAIAGVDGTVSVDGGADQTVTSIEAGGTVALTAPAGVVTATFAGGLRAGTLTAENVGVGDGTLETVVARINAANQGVTASAVQVAAGEYRLQLVSNTTGASYGPNLASAEFAAAVGALVELDAGSDATLTVGSGAGSYQVTSASNVVSGLLPGVTVTLKDETASAVTITASRDAEALADKIQAIVDAANKARSAVDVATAYDPETKRASPLTGDSTARRLQQSVYAALVNAVPWANPASPGLAGVGTDKDGKYTFDRAKFLAAYAADPTGVERAFTQGGTATSADVAFVSAGDRTRAGTYGVVITQAAAQATDIGLEGAWPIAVPPTVRVKVGTTEVSYTIQAGDLQADVVDALNAAFEAADLALHASVDGTGVRITTEDYGAAARFEVAWDGATWEEYEGTDVAGTIDGVAATGTGRQLLMAFDHPSLGGLALQISATTAGNLGTFTYEPGVAQRLASAVLDATDSATGYLTTTENARRSRKSFIDEQVESMEVRLKMYEVRLRRQWADLETTMGVLRQQANWLSGQIASTLGQQQG